MLQPKPLSRLLRHLACVGGPKPIFLTTTMWCVGAAGRYLAWCGWEVLRRRRVTGRTNMMGDYHTTRIAQESVEQAEQTFQVARRRAWRNWLRARKGAQSEFLMWSRLLCLRPAAAARPHRIPEPEACAWAASTALSPAAPARSRR